MLKFLGSVSTETMTLLDLEKRIGPYSFNKGVDSAVVNAIESLLRDTAPEVGETYPIEPARLPSRLDYAFFFFEMGRVGLAENDEILVELNGLFWGIGTKNDYRHLTLGSMALFVMAASLRQAAYNVHGKDDPNWRPKWWGRSSNNI